MDTADTKSGGNAPAKNPAAVIGAIVGEFIGGQGLGSVVDVARTQQRTDKVFAAVLLASGLGLALFGFINVLSRLALRRWHASEQT